MAERDDTIRTTVNEFQDQARKELEDAVVRAVNAGLTAEQVEDAVEHALRIAEGA